MKFYHMPCCHDLHGIGTPPPDKPKCEIEGPCFGCTKCIEEMKKTNSFDRAELKISKK